MGFCILFCTRKYNNRRDILWFVEVDRAVIKLRYEDGPGS